MKKISLYILALSFFYSCNNDDDIPTINEEPLIETFEFDTTITQLNMNQKFGHEIIKFNDAYWVIGGAEINYVNQDNLSTNNIWKSTDLVSWTKIKEHTPFDARKDFNLFKFQNKLWIIAGVSTQDHLGIPYSTAFNADKSKNWKGDVWNSNDGITWNKVSSHGPWSLRREPSVGVFNNQLFLIGGHKTQNWHVNQDIWSSNDGINWEKKGELSDDILATTESREGIYRTGLINYKNEFYMLGGDNSSPIAFSGFDRVLYSKDGINWRIKTDTPPWKNQHFSTPHAKPFIFKNKLWVLMRMFIEDSSAVGGNVLKYQLYNTSNGKDWTMVLEDFPKINDRFTMDNPRVIVENNTINFIGSYSNFFDPAKNSYLIELKLK